MVIKWLFGLRVVRLLRKNGISVSGNNMKNGMIVKKIEGDVIVVKM